MFNKTNTPSASGGQPAAAPRPTQSRQAGVPSILGRDISITGDIKTDGDVQVDGRLDGNIKAGTLTIGEQGAVNGKVIAARVLVRGKVTGKIEADIVDLAETANVQADIVQNQLTIANGAFFDGKCSRKTPAPGPVKAAAKAKVKTS
jgi:cytoskeletal protein CcmA (bactofilin family)